MLTLAAKKAIVEEIALVASKAISAVVADYRGLTVNQMTQLRSEARKTGVFLQVVKNTLTKKAVENTDFACLSDHLVGPLFVAFSMKSPRDAAKLLKDHTKIFDKLNIKALAVGGRIYSISELDVVASLPTKDEAISKIMYVSKAPVEKLTRTMSATYTKLLRTVVAIKDQKN